MYIAHISTDKSKKPHYLKDHRDAVEFLVLQFTETFDPFALGQISAIMHDQGKKSRPFFIYINSSHKKRGSVQHAIGGAIILNQIPNENTLIIILASLIVAGHHAGLPNFTELQDKLDRAPDALKKIVPLAHEEQKQADKLLTQSLQEIDQLPKTIDYHWYFSTLTRFCFSALVDADWLDTERYFNQQKTDLRSYTLPEPAEFLPELQQHMKKLTKNSPSSQLNHMRRTVYDAATQAALKKENFFTLHAPTGSGKTLAALSFALHHAKEFHKQCIIFALPLTNLTEQTSKTYRSILGNEHVIEHHSQLNLDDTQESMDKKRLATENWTHFCIVTTTVQLFESLFHNRPSKMRKLHHIANSIIILDEYQKLPLHVLKPILFMLKTLREHFNVTMLFMSATPLALEQSKVLPNVGNPYEIIEQPRQLFRSISRIQYHEIKQLLTEDELVLLAKEHTSVLCIVNTRKEAQRVFQTMNRNNSWDRIYHFSTTMCSAHRLRVIKEIKEIQNDPTNKETIAVISTQALEAGIDISFPAVFRMYAPFDSIIQSAGRCNRENVLERGNVYLFDLINRQKTDPYYEKATILTKSFIARYGIASLNNPDACITYFRELYSLMEDNGLDRYNINKDKLFQFKEVAEDFKMIENQHQVSVLCLNYPGFPHDIYEEQTFSREWIRMLQPFMIPLSIKSQDIQCINEIYVWEGTYDPDIGYQL